MKAIITKYHGPTNVKGSRVSAREYEGRSVMLSLDNSDNFEGNCAQACEALCKRLNWTGKLHGGHLKPGVMVWVFEDSWYTEVIAK